MKKIFIVFLPLLNLYANESVQFKKIVEDSCHQSITNTFSYESNNTNICNFTYINKFPEEAEKKLSSINAKILVLENSKIEVRTNSKRISKFNTEIQSLRKQILEINNLNRFYLTTIEKSLKNQDTKTSKSLENMNMKFLTLDNRLKNVDDKLSNYISETNKKLGKIADTNDRQDDKLEKLSQYILDFNNINTGVDFYYHDKLDTGFNFEVENLDKKENSVHFIKLSYVKLSETTTYKTLGSIKEELNNDKNLYSLDIGYRKIFNTHRLINKSNMYLGASFGGAYISNDKYTVLSGSFFGGIEYNDMFIGEFGYKFLSNVSSKHIDFDGLGSNNPYYKKENKLIPFLSIKYLWR